MEVNNTLCEEINVVTVALWSFKTVITFFRLDTIIVH